jgi:hypothetical protein
MLSLTIWEGVIISSALSSECQWFLRGCIPVIASSSGVGAGLCPSNEKANSKTVSLLIATPRQLKPCFQYMIDNPASCVSFALPFKVTMNQVIQTKGPAFISYDI